MEQKYSDLELLEALERESPDGLMGPTYHEYLRGANRPSAEVIRARFGSWTNAVREAGMIPAARRTEEEMKRLVLLGKIDPKYVALRLGISVRQLQGDLGLKEPKKPTKERYIDEGVRIARKIGHAPAFHEFNKHTESVTAWNPYRLYSRDWKAFKADIEKQLSQTDLKDHNEVSIINDKNKRQQPHEEKVKQVKNDALSLSDREAFHVDKSFQILIADLDNEERKAKTKAKHAIEKGNYELADEYTAYARAVSYILEKTGTIQEEWKLLQPPDEDESDK
ncbi:MAG: homing endonuclease associated repeat-containing protein [Thermoleophilia bacterium]